MMKKIYLITLIFLSLFGLSSCGLLDSDYAEPAKHTEPAEQVFFAPYDQVWRAAQLAIARYPMRINNMDTGLLETDLIGGASAWNPPGTKKKALNSQHYILRIQVIKGKTVSTKAVKVVVEKIIRLKSNFFADAKPVASDGLEERLVLYRTGRILTIERAIEVALNQNNQGKKKDQKAKNTSSDDDNTSEENDSNNEDSSDESEEDPVIE